VPRGCSCANLLRPAPTRRELDDPLDIAVVQTCTRDDENTAVTQTSAKLQVEPDLGGIFGVNVFSAQGAGNAVVNAGLGGVVDVIAFDATIRAVELMEEGVVSLIIAQKPYDMGYMGVQFCMADAGGVTSLPRRVTTGFAVITADNVDDPEVNRFIYRVE
jgi:ribose transport system substrate-binding protein